MKLDKPNPAKIILKQKRGSSDFMNRPNRKKVSPKI